MSGSRLDLPHRKSSSFRTIRDINFSFKSNTSSSLSDETRIHDLSSRLQSDPPPSLELGDFNPVWRTKWRIPSPPYKMELQICELYRCIARSSSKSGTLTIPGSFTFSFADAESTPSMFCGAMECTTQTPTVHRHTTS
jgi:hypothetical protein